MTEWYWQLIWPHPSSTHASTHEYTGSSVGTMLNSQRRCQGLIRWSMWPSIRCKVFWLLAKSTNFNMGFWVSTALRLLLHTHLPIINEHTLTCWVWPRLVAWFSGYVVRELTIVSVKFAWENYVDQDFLRQWSVLLLQDNITLHACMYMYMLNASHA